ncbi:GFA family protein [Thalassomonas sp. M1454]|uniref:GFA family protein n=1 Tax=Thalassomonas sp. M1454 TaxID=2594477 RepID=UPI00117DC11D|nr:GFA family protein [Thalassomonas sp. M1454]TRX56598.1 GFA family protein [Thalassomonas sp. M1454]
MTKEVAQCQCGQLQIVCANNYLMHGQCSCEDCQRRTGTPTSFHLYYKAKDVEIKGEFKTFTRKAEEGREIEFIFCPECGGSLAFDIPWADDVYGEKMTGIPLGNFTNPKIAAPDVSVWNCYLPTWFPNVVTETRRMAEQPKTIDDIKLVLRSLGKL